MTKEELVDLVKIRLGDKFQIAVIEKALGRAWNQILYNTFKNNPDDLDLYVKEYYIEADSITADENTGIYSFTLPSAISQLPRFEQIRNIRPKEDVTNEFSIVSLSQRATLSNLQVMDISEHRTLATIKGSKIEFTDISTANITGGLIADIVISFDGYDDTDIIYVPSGQDSDLIRMTTEYLIGTPSESQLDNNTNKQT
jgi:hypothetical protein